MRWPATAVVAAVVAGVVVVAVEAAEVDVVVSSDNSMSTSSIAFLQELQVGAEETLIPSVTLGGKRFIVPS